MEIDEGFEPPEGLWLEGLLLPLPGRVVLSAREGGRVQASIVLHVGEEVSWISEPWVGKGEVPRALLKRAVDKGKVGGRAIVAEVGEEWRGEFESLGFERRADLSLWELLEWGPFDLGEEKVSVDPVAVGDLEALRRTLPPDWKKGRLPIMAGLSRFRGFVGWNAQGDPEGVAFATPNVLALFLAQRGAWGPLLCALRSSGGPLFFLGPRTLPVGFPGRWAPLRRCTRLVLGDFPFPPEEIASAGGALGVQIFPHARRPPT